VGIFLMPFALLLKFFYDFFQSYGIALILFALIIKLVLFPFSLKGKRSMIQMNLLSGKMQQLQKQYGKDRERYNLEVQKLYEKEKVNPMSGCLWSFIPILFLMVLYGIIREPLTYFMGLTMEQIQLIAQELDWQTVAVSSGRGTPARAARGVRRASARAPAGARRPGQPQLGRGMDRRPLVFHGILPFGARPCLVSFGCRAGLDDRMHGIFAVSFRPTGDWFPMVWSEDSREVHGVDVSQRYRDLYAAYEHTLVAQGRHTTVTFVMYDSAAHEGRSDARVAANVDVFCGAEQMGGGRTAGPRQDMNDALRFLLEKGKSYTFRYENARGETTEVTAEVGDAPLTVTGYMR